ncbi:hypothetical protein ADK18_17950 [Bacillus anthracis]|nr:hypothetical protein ADK18_17950 [Bacillus anthracis]
MFPLFWNVIVYVIISPISTICWSAVFVGLIIAVLINVSTILLVDVLIIGGGPGGLYPKLDEALFRTGFCGGKLVT